MLIIYECLFLFFNFNVITVFPKLQLRFITQKHIIRWGMVKHYTFFLITPSMWLFVTFRKEK